MKLLCYTTFFIMGTIAFAENLDELRKNFPEHFHQTVATPVGMTHFDDTGSSKNAVVLIHGVSGPLFVWDKNIETLQQLGYRVLRYDLLGRGFSSRSDKLPYSLDTYLQQLEELLESRKISDPITLVGSSFGAVISTEFTLRHPARVKKIILVGPAGFPIHVPLIARLRDVPILGDILFTLFGKSTIEKQNRHYFVGENPPAGFWDYFENQLEIPGTTLAMRLTMRNSPVQSYVDSYQRLGTLSTDVGIIWGDKDATFPYENHTILESAVKRATLITIQNAAHVPQYERPNETNYAFQQLLR